MIVYFSRHSAGFFHIRPNRINLFYLQGQFQGYRSWGIRFRIAPGSGVEIPR